VNYWNAVPLGVNQFATMAKAVPVSDGRLTLDQGAAADKMTRICYLEIYANAAPTVATRGERQSHSDHTPARPPR